MGGCKKQTDTNPSSERKINFDYEDGASMGYVVGGKWNRTNLKWYVEKWCNTLSQAETREMMVKAFKQWSDVSALTFSEASGIGQADIVISFGDNRHYTNVISGWCTSDFNVVWKNYGTLAHAWFPTSPYLPGDIHFCDLHKWAPYGSIDNSSVSLLSVAIHEIGHSIGINHSQEPEAIMYASYNPQNIKYSLAQDDINAVRALYPQNSGGGTGGTGGGTSSFTIGQQYGGGVIFYIDASGQHGLIAASNDQGSGIRWNNGSFSSTSAQSTSDGSFNTTQIIIEQGNTGSYAAKRCRDYRGGGYTDWYLPAKDQLNILHSKKGIVGGFTNSNYWSSTQFQSSNAWQQDFNDGSQAIFGQDATANIRAIRSF